MKKVLLVVGLLIGTSVLTGCGTETLTCTMSDSTSMYEMEQEVTATFSGKKTETVEATITMKVDEAYKENMDALKESVEKEMTDYEKDYDVETNVSVEGTTLKYSMKADSNKMNDDAKALFGFDTESDQSKETAQKQLEDAGYTCK